MENITHSLTGLFLSQAGLNRITPHATLLLVLAANAPDIDILALAGGGLNYFHYHRHLTHSLIFAPVLAVGLVSLFQLGLKLAGGAPLLWIASSLAALAGILSHLLLDFTNNYGIRLLLPFSGRWLAADICAIYDIWILGFFLLCLAAPLLSKLVGGEIGAISRRPYPSRTPALMALSFLLLYDSGRFVLHQRALATLDAREYDGSPAVRVGAFPSPSNPFQWKGLVETSSTYRQYELNLLGIFDPSLAEIAFKAEPNAAIDAANRTEPFLILPDFARFPLWRMVPAGSGAEVTLTDMRFPFVAEAIVRESGKIESSRFFFSR